MLWKPQWPEGGRFHRTDRDDGHNQRSGVLLLQILTPLAGYAVYRLVKSLQQKVRFIEAIEKLPGPKLRGSHPSLAHAEKLLQTVGTIPEYPFFARSVDWFIEQGKPYCREGIFHVWVFNPYRFPFARALVLVVDPELAKQLLTDRKHTIPMVKEKRMYKLSGPLIADSFLPMPDDQPEWKLHRKIVARSFHHQFLEYTNATVVRLLSNKIFPIWDQEFKGNRKITVEMVEFATRLTLDVLGEVAFSCSFGGLDQYMKHSSATTATASPQQGEEEESMYELYRHMLAMVARIARSPPLVPLFWIRDQIQYRRRQRRLDSFIHELIQQRMENNYGQTSKGYEDTLPPQQQQQHKDLLSFLMAEHDDGYRMPYKYIFGTTRMLVFAGHDTTAGALAGTMWQLAKHQHVQQRLQQEVDATFTKLGDKPPSYSDIMQMKYLDCVIKESLRLHAPAVVGRSVEKDVTVTNRHGQTFTIPQGTSLYVFPLVSSHFDEYYTDSLEFQPERFEDPQSYISQNWSYPFSFGPRNCVGQPLAVTELKVVIAQLLRRYTLKVNAHATEPIHVATLTVKPHQILLDVELR